MTADMGLLPVGHRVEVTIPATSANLGPGYDCAGLALAWYDDLSLVRTEAGTGLRIFIDGEGADELTLDRTHLVVQAFNAGLEAAGVRCADVELRCVNRIPHGRGLGSSSAAIIGGLLLARELLGDQSQALNDDAILSLATDMEGHPDNVAPALLGGFTIAWTASGVGRAVRKQPHPDLRAVVFVPEDRLATFVARELLPTAVPLSDATFNLARAALLVEAVTNRPDLLFEATTDRLHQDYRRDAYPNSWSLVRSLRGAGHAAYVSGAGPAVVVLCLAAGVETVFEAAATRRTGFESRVLELHTR